jgi:hypothetical protein
VGQQPRRRRRRRGRRVGGRSSPYLRPRLA